MHIHIYIHNVLYNAFRYAFTLLIKFCILLMCGASIFKILRLRRAFQHFHPAIISVLTIGSEKVYVIFKR